MRLEAELRAFSTARRPQLPPEAREIMDRAGRDLAAVYDRFGFDLQRVNGGHARTLPLPATYVIDRAGTIRWAFVDPDYTQRAEPADILDALDARHFLD